MLHLDLPTAAELIDLAMARTDLAVSLFLPTTPASLETDADRILLKKLTKEAVVRAQAAGADLYRIAALAEALDDLIDDDAFWRYQAHGLAIYATADNLRTFRLPHTLAPLIAVSERFHLRPLLRSVTFCNACYVLALADGGVRLIEVAADLPAGEVKVIGMPKALASSLGEAGGVDRSPSGRPVGAEGEKVLLRHYARQVDAALRGLLAGSDIPLVLASGAAMGAIYRSVNTYPHLAAQGIPGSPEWQTEAELASAARGVLDGLYREQLAKWTALYRQRATEGRATTDLAQAARAATGGAVQSLLVDLDRTVHGTVGETDGAVTLTDGPDADRCEVIEETARRVLLSGGQVWSVPPADLPGTEPLAAILRYAI
ncbi:hypothetical protein [uncultured Thiodictyon sp.]|uniref:baeRF11 domain-containing protein n=1 Tax=uncultured Thiodictyon sp. TaxID=1846217 RepID=UPI0025EF097B|nr:hypothetical protein [uncultured Thiodictyon sp.]